MKKDTFYNTLLGLVVQKYGLGDRNHDGGRSVNFRPGRREGGRQRAETNGLYN